MLVVSFYVSELGIHQVGWRNSCKHSVNNSRVETMVSQTWGLRFCSHHACSLVGDLAMQQEITDTKAKLCLCLKRWKNTISSATKDIVMWGLDQAGIQACFPRKVVSELQVQWEEDRGNCTGKESDVGGSKLWSGPLKKHGWCRQLIGSWGGRSTQGWDDRKPLALLRVFQNFLLCSSLPPLQSSHLGGVDII